MPIFWLDSDTGKTEHAPTLAPLRDRLVAWAICLIGGLIVLWGIVLP